MAGAVVATREEDKRSWRVLRGDSVREIARMGLRKGRWLRVDNSVCILDHVVDTPLREDVAGYLGDARKDLGCNSAGHTDPPLNRVSIRRCSARTGPRLSRKRK